MQMTVKDTSQPMAKRQKIESDKSYAKDMQASDISKEERPSDEEVIGVIIAATRTEDINTVDFSYNSSDFKVSPGEEPLSDSDIPPRQKRDKKKKAYERRKVREAFSR
ncbi:uncharacterized protein LOC128545879 isoform X2 [Mercenaria mercenaria]|uniref:uncharacterized protein LOC128545879 isoform X2 n=1 Tax=Mercenaria mercenaria TaxID=6596 RepID=UPI00234E60F6|nr:uncharacterized protein LOC128545879 isoform X2 [Mercenaria mercenaria]